MDIRRMRVRMRHRYMPVRMRVRLPPIPVRIVLMLVMFIVDVLVRMLQRVVGVFMFVMLGKMQPDARRHQPTGNPESGTRRFLQQQQRQPGANERRG